MPLKCFTMDWTHLGRSTEDLIETHPEATVDQFLPGTPCFCSHMEDESLNNGRKWSLVNVSDITIMTYMLIVSNYVYFLDIYSPQYNSYWMWPRSGPPFKNREKQQPGNSQDAEMSWNVTVRPVYFGVNCQTKNGSLWDLLQFAIP